MLGRLAALVLAGSLAATAQSSLVDPVNRRWQGAHCRTRIPLDVKKQSNKTGWSKGPWVWIEPAKTKYRLFVRPWSALQGLLRDGHIPVGTVLLAEGWRLEHPEADHGLVLELRFADAPVQARFEFYGAWTRLLSVEHLDEMERLMRFEILELLTAGDEQLVKVGTGATGIEGQQSQPTRPPTSGPAVTAAPARPEVRMIAVAVQPFQVAPGEEIALVLTFAVESAPPGLGVQVLERREILSGDTRLTVLEEKLSRGNGTFTSRQPIRVPPDLSPGLYTLRGSVRAAERESAGSALFEVIDNSSD